jgi:hypothetical protein
MIDSIGTPGWIKALLRSRMVGMTCNVRRISTGVPGRRVKSRL